MVASSVAAAQEKLAKLWARYLLHADLDEGEPPTDAQAQTTVPALGVWATEGLGVGLLGSRLLV